MRGLFAVEPLYEGFQVRYTQSPISTQQICYSGTQMVFIYATNIFLNYPKLY